MDSYAIGKNLKEMRKALNLTQRQLSEISKVSYSTLAKLESNVIKNPKISQLQKLSKALNAQIEEFYPPKIKTPKITIPTTNLEHVMESFSTAQSSMSRITDQHAKLIKSISSIDFTHFSDIATKTEGFLKTLTQTFTFDYLDGIAEIIKRVEKEDSKNRHAMEESGWFLSPSMMEVSSSIVLKAFRDYRGGDRKAIQKLVKKTFSQDKFKVLDEANSKWLKNKYFKGRATILTQAINAHKRRDYAVSIPAMLSQIEGIAGQFCIEHPDIKATKSGKVKLKKALQNSNPAENLHYKDVIQHLIDSILFADTNNRDYIKTVGSDSNTVLNRNGILHGSITGYDTEENSYKCILYLDVLSKLI